MPLPLSSKKVLPYFDTSTVLGSGVEAPTDAALPGAALIVFAVGTAAAVLLLPLSNAGLGQCYYKWQSTSSLVRNADWASAIMWQSTSSYREALQMGASALAAIGGTDPSDARGIASKLVLLRMLAC